MSLSILKLYFVLGLQYVEALGLAYYFSFNDKILVITVIYIKILTGILHKPLLSFHMKPILI